MKVKKTVIYMELDKSPIRGGSFYSLSLSNRTMPFFFISSNINKYKDRLITIIFLRNV